MYDDSDFPATEQPADGKKQPSRQVILGIVAVLLLIATVGLGYNVYHLNEKLAAEKAGHTQAVTASNQKGQRIADLTADLTISDASRQSLQQNVQTLEERLRQANETVGELNARWQQERADRNTVVARLNQTVITVTGERNTLANQNRNLAGDKATLEHRNNTLAGENSALSSENHILTRTNETLSQENSALTGDQTARQQQIGALQAANRELANNAGNLNARINTLQNQLNAAQDQASAAQARQISIPACASNYYTASNGRLWCVARNTTVFQADQGETKTINLPHSGTIQLKINRAKDRGAANSMAILEHAVRTIEDYMGKPIPLTAREVRVDFVEDLNLDGSYGGVYLGTHVEILQEYDADSRENTLGSILAHEIAHYYWNGDKSWLDEGAADFLEIYSENRRIGTPMTPKNIPCAETGAISELERNSYSQEDAGYGCNYSLGEGLFLDLFNQLAADQFQHAFQELNAAGRNKLGGVYQVRQAFHPGSERIQQVIDHWYGYREQPEKHWPDGTFMGYLTWPEPDGWKSHQPGAEPCAATLRLNDLGDGGYRVRTVSDDCQYTGEWNEQGALNVTVNGETYRAVAVRISRKPMRFDRDNPGPTGK